MIPLGITSDKKIVFKKHIENLYRAAQYNFHALHALENTLDKATLLGNTFIIGFL